MSCEPYRSMYGSFQFFFLVISGDYLFADRHLILKGQMLTLIEYTLLLYRAILPTPVWYRFFLNKDYGSLFSSLTTGLYLTFKLTSVVEKVFFFSYNAIFSVVFLCVCAHQHMYCLFIIIIIYWHVKMMMTQFWSGNQFYIIFNLFSLPCRFNPFYLLQRHYRGGM